jgi:hypothetical protein
MMNGEKPRPLSTLIAERKKLVEAAREFDHEGKNRQLASEEIQNFIEELYPIRLRIHLLDQLIKEAQGSSE